MKDKAKRIAKAIAAYLGTSAATITTWLGTLPEGHISMRSWAFLGVALVAPVLVSLGVYGVPNAPPAT